MQFQLLGGIVAPAQPMAESLDGQDQADSSSDVEGGWSDCDRQTGLAAPVDHVSESERDDAATSSPSSSSSSCEEPLAPENIYSTPMKRQECTGEPFLTPASDAKADRATMADVEDTSERQPDNPIFSCDFPWRRGIWWWLSLILCGPLFYDRVACGEQVSAIELLSVCSGFATDLMACLASVYVIGG